jgi:hypothetical protein
MPTGSTTTRGGRGRRLSHPRLELVDDGTTREGMDTDVAQ